MRWLIDLGTMLLGNSSGIYVRGIIQNTGTVICTLGLNTIYDSQLNPFNKPTLSVTGTAQVDLGGELTHYIN